MSNMQECKVLFKPETTREQAEALVKRYSPEAKIDSFYEKRLIGCNEVTFGVVTLPIKDSTKLQDDLGVIRVEVITTFKASKTCEGGGCGCKP